MPQVQLGPDFFKKERDQVYADPPLAVWRELFQNAIDQDAGEIAIDLKAETDLSGEEWVSLTFADNGPGMSRKVLDEVYFNIGNSTKDNDPTKIGGMGRARMLTCFAMKSYRILSQGYHVIGRAGHYEVEDHPWTSGCRLMIEVDGYSLDIMQAALDRFLSESKIAARIILNGTRLVSKAMNAGRHVRDLSANGHTFARIWVNKSAKTNRVIVRVNGVAMFTKPTNANAQVIVDLEPALSRKVLTANRDALHFGYSLALDRFLSELAVDTTSALQSRMGRRTTVVRGGGMKTVYKPVVAASGASGYLPPPQPSAALYEAPGGLSEAVHDEDTFNEVQNFDSWLRRTFGDIYLFDETENAAIRKVLGAYNPSSWQMSEKRIRGTTRPYRKGGNVIRVLLMWHTAINYAIEVAMDVLGKTEIPFAVGFVFGDGQSADHRAQDGGHIFSLCPVNAQGKLNFTTTDVRDLRRLCTFAKHEVTHVSVAWHGEGFCGTREAIDVEFDTTECLRRMKKALRLASGV